MRHRGGALTSDHLASLKTTSSAFRMKDGEPYTSGILGENEKVLNIQRVGADDAGEFSCFAVNRAGNATIKFKTKVFDCPPSYGTLLFQVDGVPRSRLYFLFLLFIPLALLLCAVISAGVYINRQRKRSAVLQNALDNLYEEFTQSTKEELVQCQEEENFQNAQGSSHRSTTRQHYLRSKSGVEL